MKNELYDISEVCDLLGITSRTLRFYEQKGIIESTTDGFSSRRKYTNFQLNNIRNVLVLRSLGLSIKDILKLQYDDTDLKNTIISKRAEIIASIEKRIREINILNDAISVIEAGENIFDTKLKQEVPMNSDLKRIIDECTEAIVFGKTDKLYEHMSENMLQCLPLKVFEKAREDTLSVLGDFVSFDGVEADSKYPNKIYSFVRYERLGLIITFVLNNNKIDGLWLSYFDKKGDIYEK